MMFGGSKRIAVGINQDWHYQRATCMATMILDPELERDLRDQRAAWGGDRFDEVWEGIYIMSPLADNEHQEIALQLGAAIRAAVGWDNPIKILPGANVSDREDGWEFNY